MLADQIRYGGTAEDEPFDLAVGVNNCFYVTGSIRGVLTVDSLAYPSSGGRDFFIAKFDSAGNTIWAIRPVQSSFSGRGLSITVDSIDNVYCTGFFHHYMHFPQDTITAPGYAEFILKTSASGSLISLSQTASISNFPELEYDFAGHLIMVGSFTGTVDFGGPVLSAIGPGDLFVAKYDLDLNLKWIRQIHDSLNFTWWWHLSTDSNQNIFIGGRNLGHLHFGNGIDYRVSPSSGYDFCFAQFRKDGLPLWADQINNVQFLAEPYLYAIHADNQGNLFLTGKNGGMAVYGNDTLTTSYAHDMFLSKYHFEGNCLPPIATSSQQINPTAFRLSWDTVSGSSGYLIQGRAITSNQWVYLNVSGGSSFNKSVMALHKTKPTSGKSAPSAHRVTAVPGVP